MSNKALRLLRQQVQDVTVEVDALGEQARRAQATAEQLETTRGDTEQRLASKRLELDDRAQECDQLHFESTREVERIQYELVPVNDLLELFEQRGG